MGRRLTALAAVLLLLLVGCGGEDTPEATAPRATDPPTTTVPPVEDDAPATTAAPATELTRPAWLGTRVLPRRPDGFGEVQPTPAELRDRRLPTEDLLPPPPDDRFTAAVHPVPDDVLGRSTWSPQCPVARHDLRYLTVAFWGFDGRPHTGELLVHAAAADAMVGVFRRLHEARFPIEEMRVVAPPELDAPPTGDGNNTTAFVCRPSRQSTSWSDHAYGRAIDVNPFHNPYSRRDVVLPELASAYLDRSWDRPGMIQAGGPVVAAFGDIGWPWGGNWRSPKDYMHFSASGR